MSGLDLYLSQRTLALMFVYASLTGFCLGLIYDGLRILRMALGERILPPRSPEQGRSDPKLLLRIFRFFEDVIFMLTASVALILICYYTSDGQFRAPAPLGMACGFFVYIHTISRWVLRLADATLGLVCRLLFAFLRLLAVPLRGLWVLTVGRMIAAHRERVTEKAIDVLTESAKDGFGMENNGKPPA